MNRACRNARLRCPLRWQGLGLSILLGLMGCGGGGSSQGPPPPVSDFTLAVSPTTQFVDAGSSASVSLSATAVGTFSSQISVQVTGVPAGVTASATAITLIPGAPQQVTFTAAATAPNANTTVTFTGSSGSLTHTAGLSLTVNGASNGVPVRTRYVRTDATTEYYLWVNQHWMLYHAATGRYFVTDTSSNQIIVLDAASESVIARIGVPGAFGMDDTPDHSTIYVGTQIGDVYAVDPVAMTVKQRYIASEIGPYGFQTSQVLALADGRLALIGLYNGIDGTIDVAVWNPADNSAIVYGGLGGVGLPCNGLGTLGGFARTVDRTKILLGNINGGGLCAVDPTAGTGILVQNGASDLHITTTPDGKYIIMPSSTGVIVYDSQTLAPVSQFSPQGGTGPSSGFVVSADSTKLYVPQETVIYAYDLATGQLVGWLPNMYVQFTSGGMAFGPITSPYLLATDGSGLFAGPTEEGIGFVDLSTLQTGAVGTQFVNGYLNPATGPTSGGTPTSWTDAGTVGPLKSIYFGSKQATAISAGSGYINATSPAGKPGPADVYTFTNDGGMQLLPEAFSYGPTILEVTPNMASAEGGGTGVIFGYGLGPVTATVIPSDLQVKVAGVSVSVTGFVPNAYGLLAPPFPLQAALYTIPPGVSGTSADVAVSNSSGSATAKGALAYLPTIQKFPLPSGSTLVQGIYDSYTDLYYFTDASKIQVFSRTQGKWLSPIAIPAPRGTTQRLWGIALSPDGSKLAVADASAGAIYVLDPASPASVKTFLVGSEPGGAPIPCGVAISDSGVVYYVTIGAGIGGGDQFYKLDTNSGQITNYGIEGPDVNGDAGLRTVISSDNSRVFYNDDGWVFYIDTATDEMFSSPDGYGCCYGNYELALSSNQTQFSATFYIYDSDLNGESYYAMNDREILNIQYVYGAKLSPDGRLLFQPSTNGIDVFDGHLGNLQTRISLPVPLSPNYDTLVDDGRDNILIAITGAKGNGIAIIDLTSLPEPLALPYNEAFVSYTHRLAGLGSRLDRNFKSGLHSGQHYPRAATLPRTVPHVTGTLLQHPK